LASRAQVNKKIRLGIGLWSNKIKTNKNECENITQYKKGTDIHGSLYMGYAHRETTNPSFIIYRK
jgi:hypothetical protein